MRRSEHARCHKPVAWLLHAALFVSSTEPQKIDVLTDINHPIDESLMNASLLSLNYPSKLEYHFNPSIHETLLNTSERKLSIMGCVGFDLISNPSRCLFEVNLTAWQIEALVEINEDIAIDMEVPWYGRVSKIVPIHLKQTVPLNSGPELSKSSGNFTVTQCQQLGIVSVCIKLNLIDEDGCKFDVWSARVKGKVGIYTFSKWSPWLLFADHINVTRFGSASSGLQSVHDGLKSAGCPSHGMPISEEEVAAEGYCATLAIVAILVSFGLMVIAKGQRSNRKATVIRTPLLLS